MYGGAIRKRNHTKSCITERWPAGKVITVNYFHGGIGESYSRPTLIALKERLISVSEPHSVTTTVFHRTPELLQLLFADV
eukprot:gene581-951_t